MDYTNIVVSCLLIFAMGVVLSFAGRKVGGAIRKLFQKIMGAKNQDEKRTIFRR